MLADQIILVLKVDIVKNILQVVGQSLSIEPVAAMAHYPMKSHREWKQLRSCYSLTVVSVHLCSRPTAAVSLAGGLTLTLSLNTFYYCLK